MRRKNLYLALPCCMPKCVYPCFTCNVCEYATDDLSVLFDNANTNILCFL